MVASRGKEFEFSGRRSKKMTSAVSKIIEDLRDRGGLKGTDVANIASVSPATVSRWSAGKALPHPKTQLVISDLRYVVDRLSEFYTPDETRLWLYSKHRLLNGERAIDLINQGGADKNSCGDRKPRRRKLHLMSSGGRVHDRSVLDALEKLDPEPFDLDVWRVGPQRQGSVERLFRKRPMGRAGRAGSSLHQRTARRSPGRGRFQTFSRTGVAEPHSTPDTYSGRQGGAHLAPRGHERTGKSWRRYLPI